MPEKVTKTEALADIQRVADALGKPPTRAEYSEHGQYSAPTAAKHHDNSFTAARAAALDVPDERQAEIRRDTLLADIRAVADAVDGEPSKTDYKAHGDHALSTITYRFESWVDAKQEAGVYDGLDAGPTREELIADLRRVDAEVDGAVSQTVYNEHGEWSQRTVQRRFDSWEDGCQQAGVTRPKRGPRTEGTSELIEDIRRVAEQLAHTPSRTEYHEHGRFSRQMAIERIGSWPDAVRRAGYEPRNAGGQAGELNSNWNGGYGGYYGESWHEKRREARKRDDYECQACGMGDAEHVSEFGYGLEVHHIKPVRTFDNPDDANYLTNLVTLCTPCHQRYEQLPNERAKELVD
jgi:hypothetical protein